MALTNVKKIQYLDSEIAGSSTYSTFGPNYSSGLLGSEIGTTEDIQILGSIGTNVTKIPLIDFSTVPTGQSCLGFGGASDGVASSTIYSSSYMGSALFAVDGGISQSIPRVIVNTNTLGSGSATGGEGGRNYYLPYNGDNSGFGIYSSDTLGSNPVSLGFEGIQDGIVNKLKFYTALLGPNLAGAQVKDPTTAASGYPSISSVTSSKILVGTASDFDYKRVRLLRQDLFNKSLMYFDNIGSSDLPEFASFVPTFEQNNFNYCKGSGTVVNHSSVKPVQGISPSGTDVWSYFMVPESQMTISSVPNTIYNLSDTGGSATTSADNNQLQTRWLYGDGFHAPTTQTIITANNISNLYGKVNCYYLGSTYIGFTRKYTSDNAFKLAPLLRGSTNIDIDTFFKTFANNSTNNTVSLGASTFIKSTHSTSQHTDLYSLDLLNLLFPSIQGQYPYIKNCNIPMYDTVFGTGASTLNSNYVLCSYFGDQGEIFGLHNGAQYTRMEGIMSPQLAVAGFTEHDNIRYFSVEVKIHNPIGASRYGACTPGEGLDFNDGQSKGDSNMPFSLTTIDDYCPAETFSGDLEYNTIVHTVAHASNTSGVGDIASSVSTKTMSTNIEFPYINYIPNHSEYGYKKRLHFLNTYGTNTASSTSLTDTVYMRPYALFFNQVGYGDAFVVGSFPMDLGIGGSGTITPQSTSINATLIHSQSETIAGNSSWMTFDVSFSNASEFPGGAVGTGANYGKITVIDVTSSNSKVETGITNVDYTNHKITVQLRNTANTYQLTNLKVYYNFTGTYLALRKLTHGMA